MIGTIANVMAIAGDRSMVDDGHNFVGVEAVNVDARGSRCRPESSLRRCWSRPSSKLTVASTAPPVFVPAAFDQPARVVGDLHAAIVCASTPSLLLPVVVVDLMVPALKTTPLAPGLTASASKACITPPA